MTAGAPSNGARLPEMLMK